jgi:hypothetical protein
MLTILSFRFGFAADLLILNFKSLLLLKEYTAGMPQRLHADGKNRNFVVLDGGQFQDQGESREFHMVHNVRLKKRHPPGQEFERLGIWG